MKRHTVKLKQTDCLSQSAVHFFQGGGCSTNSVEDRGQREQGSGGNSPLVRGST
jgi:hypothetical protein